PGNTGLPGRPLGSRQKIAEQIIKDIADDWNAVDGDGERHGPKALARLRKDDPARYVAAALGLVPKDWLISIQSQAWALQTTLEALGPDEAAKIAEALKLIGSVGPERALELLRSELAKPVCSALRLSTNARKSPMKWAKPNAGEMLGIGWGSGGGKMEGKITKRNRDAERLANLEKLLPEMHGTRALRIAAEGLKLRQKIEFEEAQPVVKIANMGIGDGCAT